MHMDYLMHFLKFTASFAVIVGIALFAMRLTATGA